MLSGMLLQTEVKANGRDRQKHRIRETKQLERQRTTTCNLTSHLNEKVKSFSHLIRAGVVEDK